MRMSRSEHRAQYDENGDIILPVTLGDWNDQPPVHPLENDIPEQRETLPPVTHLWEEVQSRTRSMASALMKEGAEQYADSVLSARTGARQFLRACRSFASRTCAFMTQPVWIIIPNRKPKHYSRGTLFLLDALRFGGTFGIIFSALFISLNYQSFWEIASEKMNPLSHAQHMQEQRSAVDTTLRDKLLRSPSLSVAGTQNGGMLAALPPVGPPENRLIIPKLGINVPLVTPSFQSLLNEDWTQVEHDIQDALQMGVVHYPGTARPGQAGNFFVTGHSSYYPWAPGRYKTIFSRLHTLEPGDEYYVYYGGDQYRYIIRSKREVRPSNVDVLDQPIDKRMATLMTCTPVGTTLRRLIVVAEEVDPVTGEGLATGERHQHESDVQKPAMLPI